MAEYVQNFKIIIALKSEKESKLGADKVKTTVLPQSEGQFFDINELSSPIVVRFEMLDSGKMIGELVIPIPKDVYEEKEVEMADQFSVEFEGEKGLQTFNGRYYIIILNKGEVPIQREQFMETIEERAHIQMQENHQARLVESPTKQFIKSTGERSHERTRKDHSKKLLAETKYDPVSAKKQSQKDQSKLVKFPSKKQLGSTNGQTKQIIKNGSMKQMSDSSKKDQVNHKTDSNDEDSRASIKPIQRQSSPYSKYRGKSQQPTYQDLQSELEFNRGVMNEQQLQSDKVQANIDLNLLIENSLQDSESKRTNLQDLVRVGIQEGVKFREEVEKEFSNIVKENLKLQKRVKQYHERNIELEKEVDQKNQLIQDQDNFLKDQQKKIHNQDDMKRICEAQQQKLEEQDQKIKENQKAFQERINNLISTTNKFQGQHTQLLAENAHSGIQIQELRIQLQRQGEYKQVEKQLEIEISRNNEQKKLIEQLKNDITILIDTKDMNLVNDLDKIKTLKEVIKDQDIKVKQLDGQLKQCSKQVLLMKDQVASLQLEVQSTKEMVKQSDTFKKHNQVMIEDNSLLAQTIEDLTESLQATNNQILELRADVLHQISLMEEGESHNNNLKRLILEMRERGVAYIPMKEDKIDQTLAYFINGRQDADRQRQLFVREGEGVYQFGSKKIYIKVEQDKILIRSGGGFILIEEFLNLYMQREMDGMMRNDPLAAISRNKAASRKRDEMKLVHSIKEEQFSPLKKKGTQILD